MGSDVVGGNTDVMFIVQIKEGTTRILQVPRDTFIESEEYGVIKANALYGMAGPEKAMAELSSLLSLPIENYFKVNLDAVARLADAIGGVEVDVPKRMYYVDNAQGLYIDLYPGPQLLRGEALEGFLRFRNDELGDLGRMDRQRLVMREVFRKLASPTAITQLPALLKIAGEDMRTNLSPLELTQMARAVVDTRLSTDRVPGSLYWHNDISYWLPDALKREAAPEPTDQTPRTADLDAAPDDPGSAVDRDQEWTTTDSHESGTPSTEEAPELTHDPEPSTSI
jgi:LCP family protein required for cell wall assembly